MKLKFYHFMALYIWSGLMLLTLYGVISSYLDINDTDWDNSFMLMFLFCNFPISIIGCLIAKIIFNMTITMGQITVLNIVIIVVCWIINVFLGFLQWFMFVPWVYGKLGVFIKRKQIKK